MTIAYNPARQCQGKVRYLTRSEAKRVRSKYPRRSNGRTMSVYLCPHCDRYHLGHAIPQEFL